MTGHAAARSSSFLLMIALLASSLAGAHAFYAGSDVVTLTESNFNSKIKSGGVWVVEVSVAAQKRRLWRRLRVG
jgi:hypothetical protein